MGVIIRTAGMNRTKQELRRDYEYLLRLWDGIREFTLQSTAPALIYEEADLIKRSIRDIYSKDIDEVLVEGEQGYKLAHDFMRMLLPNQVERVRQYTSRLPLFHAHKVEGQLDQVHSPTVQLRSGGYIVINQTEALVAIDINTGKFVGKSNRLEDTIVKTNTEAIKEIVRQIRLRDLGGIIVIDFIDMDERRNRQKVMQALEEALRGDRAPSKVLQFNDFGLVAITRKRVKQSLERTLCAPCPHCDGAGYVKSVQTVVNEILTEARKIAASVEGKDVMLRVHPDVAKVLKSHQNKYLEELEEVLRRPVLVKSDAQLHHEKFDLA